MSAPTAGDKRFTSLTRALVSVSGGGIPQSNPTWSLTVAAKSPTVSNENMTERHEQSFVWYSCCSHTYREADFPV